MKKFLLVLMMIPFLFSCGNRNCNCSSDSSSDVLYPSDSDVTGTFFDENSVCIKDIYGDIYSSVPKYETKEGKLPDGKEAGKLLNSQCSYQGYTYVVFIQSDTQESTFRSFYDNILTKEEKEHYYVVDFREERNLKSEYNMTKNQWENDEGKVNYNYLLNTLYDFYVSSEFETYNKEFTAKYNYDLRFIDVWEISAELDNAKSEIRFPVICKYKGIELIDFRFCDNFDINYQNTSSIVLNDFHTGL